MKDIQKISESFERCDASGHFADTFYDIFMSKSGEIKVLFNNTDFTQQKKLLRATVKILVSNDMDKPKTKKILEDVGRSHDRSGHNIAPYLYGLWLDSLCETVAKLDSEYTEELELLWRQQMQASINFIIARY